jgi:hypothetical protein
MEIIYKAIDGTEFDNEKECIKHETISNTINNLIKGYFYENWHRSISTCHNDIVSFIKDNKDVIIDLFTETTVEQKVIDWDEVPIGTLIEVSDDGKTWGKRCYAGLTKTAFCVKAYTESSGFQYTEWKYARPIK